MNGAGVEYRANARSNPDNVSIKFGSSGDSGLRYDGSDLVVSPALVGSGDLKVAGASLLLETGEKIDFGTGDVTLTHSAGRVTVAGGDLHLADGNGIVVGHSAQALIAGVTPEFQVLGDTAGTDVNIGIVAYTGANANNGAIYFGKSRSATVGTPGTAVVAEDRLGQIVFLGDDGTDLASAAARITAAVDGTPGVDDMPGRLVFETTADGAGVVSERMRIDSAGGVFIGETANTGMTVGLTINQGANSDEAFALKNSSMNHSLTGVAETDTALLIRPVFANGASIEGFADNDAGATRGLYLQGAVSVEPDETKSATASGIVEIRAHEDNAGSYGSVATTGTSGNLLAVRNSSSTRLVVDEDGDLHYDGSTNAASWDEHDDVALLDTFRAVTTRDYRGVFSGFTNENADVLGRTGVLTFNEDGRHFVSTKGLHGLIIDSIRQIHQTSQERLAALERELAQIRGLLSEGTGNA